jgi:hypothetical protein
MVYRYGSLRIASCTSSLPTPLPTFAGQLNRRWRPVDHPTEGRLSTDSVEKLRFNEWTSKFSTTTTVTIRFCTNLHARASRKRLPRPIFQSSDELKFSKRVFQQNRPKAAIGCSWGGEWPDRCPKRLDQAACVLTARGFAYPELNRHATAE